MSSYIRVSGGSALILVLVVAGVALRISGGGPLPIDTTIMSATARLHTPHRTSVVDVAMQVFSPFAVAVWTALAAIILLVRDASVLRAVMLVATVASAGALCATLKVLVARPRPPVTDQVGVLETTYSFPSGHVAGTAALVVAAASLVARSAGGGARTALWVCAVVAVVFVCATRLYLGVQWMSDVVAAVVVACAATLLVLPIVELAVAKWSSRRRSVLVVAILLVLSAVAVILAVDGDGMSDGASAARQAGHLAGVLATEYAEWFSAHH